MYAIELKTCTHLTSKGNKHFHHAIVYHRNVLEWHFYKFLSFNHIYINTICRNSINKSLNLIAYRFMLSVCKQSIHIVTCVCPCACGNQKTAWEYKFFPKIMWASWIRVWFLSHYDRFFCLQNHLTGPECIF